MVGILLWPALALAFSAAPKRECKEDAYCVLVKETHCGQISAVALGEDKAWADWEAKEKARAVKEGRACPPGPRPDHRAYEAVCRAGLCEATKKGKNSSAKVP